jgi:hypothetical protein
VVQAVEERDYNINGFGEPEVARIGRDEVDAGRVRPRQPQHLGRAVDAGDAVAALGERAGDAAGAAAEVEHARAGRQLR